MNSQHQDHWSGLRHSERDVVPGTNPHGKLF
jgi:hypothetical protein